MTTLVQDQPLHPLRNVRLDTLVRLRWLIVIGQALSVISVEWGLEYDLPQRACFAVIGLSALLNVALRLRFRPTQRLDPDRVAWLLAFDIAELAVLLFLTGGLQNPFAFLFLGPVILAATALPPRYTVLLGAIVVFFATVLIFVHYPLPWDPEDPLELPALFVLGVWLALLLAMGFIGIYAWQISEESRQLSDALAATEMVLAREQHISQIDGLAAAAAHELGTPLATITVIVKEIERSLSATSPHRDDVRILRDQTQRCREILSKITELSSSANPFDHAKLSVLIEEVVSPHRDLGIAIVVEMPPERTLEPVSRRNSGIIYGLGNIVENAVDFAKSRVTITAKWTEDDVLLTITDDGPGFAPEILARLGDPYVTSRPSQRDDKEEESNDSDDSGFGLGFFIAKTLLERSGGTLSFDNRKAPLTGAIVEIHWTRAAFQRGSVPASQDSAAALLVNS